MYGISPHQYVTIKRIEKAKVLFNDSEKSLEEMTNLVGFHDKSSFGRLFKRKEKKATFEYRLTHRS